MEQKERRSIIRYIIKNTKTCAYIIYSYFKTWRSKYNLEKHNRSNSKYHVNRFQEHVPESFWVYNKFFRCKQNKI